MLGALAAGVLLLQLVDTAWLVLPSIDVTPAQWLWAMPLAAVAASFMAATLWRSQRRTDREVRHA